MAAISNKWILIIILVLASTIICHADHKPTKNKQKNPEISNSSIKSKLNKGLNDKEDTLVYDRLTEDTLVFDDRTTDDTLIFADDEIKPPGYENFKQTTSPDNNTNSSKKDISFSISQSISSGDITVKIDDITSEFFEISIISIDGKLVVNKKNVINNSHSENLKPGIYYIYVKTDLKASYRKILVK